MKKPVLLTALLTFAAPMMASADESSGCGLGQTVWKGKSGLVAHISAATTNNTSANQTFGMSSGTLGCDTTTMVSNEFEKKEFVASNMDNLATDAAKGEGAHLHSLANLMGVTAEDRKAFYEMSQASYENIFEQPKADYTTVMAGFDSAMLDHPSLAKYVK